jgi:hypothetical protein
VTEVVLYRIDGGTHTQPLRSVTDGDLATKEIPLVVDFLLTHGRGLSP